MDDDIANGILDGIQSGRFEEIAAARAAYAEDDVDAECLALAWLRIIDQVQKSDAT